MSSLKNKSNLSRFTLDETNKIDESHASPAWALLREGYQSTDQMTRLVSSYLCSLLCSNRLYSLLSRPEFDRLIQNDPNLIPARKVLKDREYAQLKAILINSKFIKVILPRKNGHIVKPRRPPFHTALVFGSQAKNAFSLDCTVYRRRATGSWISFPVRACNPWE